MHYVCQVPSARVVPKYVYFVMGNIAVSDVAMVIYNCKCVSVVLGCIKIRVYYKFRCPSSVL